MYFLRRSKFLWVSSVIMTLLSLLLFPIKHVHAAKKSFAMVVQSNLSTLSDAQVRKAYRILKKYQTNSDDPYVRTKTYELMIWMQDEYPTLISSSNAELSSNWKSGPKTFVMNDGTRFTQAKSTVRQSTTSSVSTTSTAKSSVWNSEVKKQVSDINSKPSSWSIESEKNVEKTSPSISNNKSSQWRYLLDNWYIDIETVQLAWQSWVNDLRVDRNLKAISFDDRLHRTWAERAETIRNKQSADHRRFSNSAYYNYWELVDRFDQRGIVFENVSRTTFTENIWVATFSCGWWNCTDSAIDSLKHVFTYFRNEEWKEYDAHWRTMIQPFFSIMWIWISVDEDNNKIYIAIHYWTSIE